MNTIIKNNILLIKGYVESEINPGINLREEIDRMRKEKNAVILAHYYQDGRIQDIADFIGDSLYLSQQAAKTEADIIVFCGVHFMAETAKILSPSKKVLLPDLNAGCSLADSCKAEDFSEFLKRYPGHTVISYVNTTAEIKALSDIICTSSNAVQIVQSVPENEPIVFAPDKNLGNYIESLTGRKMVIWDGACHVHEQFSLERILELKRQHPEAKIIAHPECEKPLLIVADFIGSTSALLKYTQKDKNNKYIVATESGILHQMIRANPSKIFIPAPPKDVTCGCNDCMYMKLNTMQKLYNCIKFEMPEIEVEETLRVKAESSIKRMLEISEKLGL
ncbi:MAG TPA: quinolinate synthase NadA [Bacteroidales bacterium]|nr:quinolinate synthase NadA [Bacteroidales bacterium]